MIRQLDLGPGPDNLPPLQKGKTRRIPLYLQTTYSRFSGYRDKDAAIVHALRDVVTTLTLHKDKPITDPYVAKLLTEFDDLTALRQLFTKRKETR